MSNLTFHDLSWYWGFFGFLLIFAEFFLPGLISFFLGSSALLVALSLYLQWLEPNLMSCMTLWFILSILQIFTVRIWFGKFSSKTNSQKSLEDTGVGELASVLEIIEKETSNGRIDFRGSNWKAKSLDHTHHPGEQVRLVRQDGQVWLVKSERSKQ